MKHCNGIKENAKLSIKENISLVRQNLKSKNRLTL